MQDNKKSKKDELNNKAISRRQAGSDREIINLENNMRENSKQAKMIKLLKSPKGVTIDEMAKVTCWQRHSIRGMMSGVLKKRLELSITSEKEERGRVYRIAR